VLDKATLADLVAGPKRMTMAERLGLTAPGDQSTIG